MEFGDGGRGEVLETLKFFGCVEETGGKGREKGDREKESRIEEEEIEGRQEEIETRRTGERKGRWWRYKEE